MAADDRADLLDLLIDDHQALRRLFGDRARLRLHDPRRKSLADLACSGLLRHLEAEETYLYPFARQSLPQGSGSVDDGLAAHAAIRALVRDIGDGEVPFEESGRLMTELVDVATRHFDAEEAQIFALVRGDLSDVKLEALAEQAEESERH